MALVNRSEWIDDDGSGTYGTPVNNDELQKIYDNFDSEVASPNLPNVTTRSIIDNLIAGVPFDFGGDPNAWVDRGSYVTGATLDPDAVIAPGSRVWRVDTALLGGTFRLEAILRTTDVAKPARLALVNLTNAPDVPMVEITSISQTGELVRSDPIAWPVGGTVRDFAVKLMTTTPITGQANGWAYRVFREA